MSHVAFRPAAEPWFLCLVCSTVLFCLFQVAAEPLLLGVFEELLSQEGAELYTRSANHFQLPVNENLTWHEVRRAPGMHSAHDCMTHYHSWSHAHHCVHSITVC